MDMKMVLDLMAQVQGHYGVIGVFLAGMGTEYAFSNNLFSKVGLPSLAGSPVGKIQSLLGTVVDVFKPKA